MILDRYLIKEFLKVFLFSMLSFVAILFTTRLQEIAQFASIGAPVEAVFRFCLYQIPYILPIVIPIASLISGIILTQHLSSSQELTILRSSGLSIGRILAPVILVSCMVALMNFFIVSEVATTSHVASRQLQEQLKRINPLVLLNHQKQNNIQGVYIEALGGSQRSQEAHDLVIALWNKKTESIALVNAKKIEAKKPYLEADHLSLLLPQINEEANEANGWMIENIANAKTTTNNFSSMLRQRHWRLHADYLPFGMLLVALKDSYRDYIKTPEDRSTKRFFFELSHEVSRRISIAIAAITFTLLGMAYGMQIGRHRGRQGIYIVIILAAMYLVCYFTGKNMEHQRFTSTALFLFPHIIIITAALYSLRRISRGIES